MTENEPQYDHPVVEAHPSHVVSKLARANDWNRRWEEDKLLERGKNSHTLTKEIREWLNAMSKKHWYIRQPEHGRLTIHFCNKDDAMLYKLTWYGVDLG